ncbi:predicted protein [Nematostella vectensis]|uniref:Tripeptidyl-peptidase 2 n=1 Tax=Nematostella vectensis TaxID=45351 RepID=A7T1C0_NEMVE|nr:predicted protein [Nematostella vectensis]|eukprot:XP_001622345.1 predicted protein [Nematostella vectensis]
MATTVEEFPVHGLLPKRETGADRFVAKYPECDGRGTLIAILDTGVDPGALGLQTTSHGRRKIVDLIDTSGSGDVDTSTVVTPKDNGVIIGLSERQLKIPADWVNPSGVYHVGIKSLFSLFPDKLQQRIKKERKEKLWDPFHNSRVAETMRRLEEWDAKHPPKNATPKIIRESLQSEIDALSTMSKKYADCGPALDCIVFHDGDGWRACIDTSETGDLQSCKLMSDYRESGEFASFSDQDLMNYSINIYDEGNTLCIVTTGGTHGTHVASIAAGFCAENPTLTGLAPGAQVFLDIVALFILLSIRLDTMETGTALVRALIAAHDYKCDLINMSYGEAANWPNAGRVVDLMNELVNEHGVIFISSAGNNGPALSTVGCPGGTSESIIGIGAYVSPEMMAAEYSLLEKLPGNQYTWSSRGPSTDGSLGVLCVTAPGSAISCSITWTLRGSQLMNGTSMSSPNACGGIALVLSGLKARGIPYSPPSIRRALENTALRMEGLDFFTQGYGLLQVDKVFDYMEQYADTPDRNVTFQINCQGPRGIYIRQAYQLLKPYVVTATVTPKFPEISDHQSKLGLNLRLSLASTEPWVSCPGHFALMNTPRSFSVKVDPRGLPEGAHYAEIRAYDVTCPERGAVFRVPVSVIVPHRVTDMTHYEVSMEDRTFKPGQVQRTFVDVPEGATYAELNISSLSEENSARFMVHAVQLLPLTAFRTNEFCQFITLAPRCEKSLSFAVKGGVTLELCVARWWASLGDCLIRKLLIFHGMRPSLSAVTVHANQTTRVDVTCTLRPEEVSPSVTLNTHAQPLRPTESKITPLASRDVLFKRGQIYALNLTYNFNQSRAGEINPNAVYLSDLLYESEYESQIWMLYDTNKRLLGCGDAFHTRYTAKIEKGDYILKYQVRHDNRDQLEKLKDMVVLIETKLTPTLPLDVHPSRLSAMTGGKFTAFIMQKGWCWPVFINPLPDDKLPKGVKPGHILRGKITFFKNDPGKKVDTHPIEYIVPLNPAKQNNKISPQKPEKDGGEPVGGASRTARRLGSIIHSET